MGKKIGKQTAHHMLGKAASTAMRENLNLNETLIDISEVKAVMSTKKLEEIIDNYRHI